MIPLPQKVVWTHRKSGKTYHLLSIALSEEDLKPQVVYQETGPIAEGRNIDLGVHHRKTFVRDASKFLDGRFYPSDPDPKKKPVEVEVRIEGELPPANKGFVQQAMDATLRKNRPPAGINDVGLAKPSPKIDAKPHLRTLPGTTDRTVKLYSVAQVIRDLLAEGFDEQDSAVKVCLNLLYADGFVEAGVMDVVNKLKPSPLRSSCPE